MRRLFDYIKNIVCCHQFSVKCVLNFQVSTDVRCLGWDFLGYDTMWSCKGIPTFWSNFMPSSLGFKGHFCPKNGGSMFHQNLVVTYKTAWHHTPENRSLNCEVWYIVIKELIFTTNVVCSIPPVTERNK
jgi:hypothetical protein